MSSVSQVSLREVLSNQDSALAVTAHLHVKEERASDVVKESSALALSPPVLLKIRQTPLPSSEEEIQMLLNQMVAQPSNLKPRMPYSGTEYGYYTCEVPASIAVDVVCAHMLPDSVADEEARNKLHEKHVLRNTATPTYMVRETPADYLSAHLPYINDIPAGAIAWVYKILAGEKEKERLLFNDKDMLLNVDPKWSTHPDVCPSDNENKHVLKNHDSTKNLYCLGLCHRLDVKSIRDLTDEHIPLLSHMLDEGTKRIEEVYGTPRNALRVFVHYPPQFYHFHVHYTSVDGVDFGINTERAHLLEDIIDNLKCDGSFYKKANLTCRLGATDKLWKKFQNLSG